jgi:glycosyltransferase involved in cell wall biosynthesis
MYRGLSIAIVIPAFNEERAIADVIGTAPDWVDRILVVDDASRDRTAEVARRSSSQQSIAAAAGHSRVEVISHARNRGVGAAIISGYRRVLELGLDVAAVMAGDGQMDPRDLSRLLDPIADGRCDYAKGNRFLHPDVWRVMPPTRLFGNIALSLATRLTSGYRRVFDSQCGYTAIHRRALKALDLAALFPRYGYPNDLLARLHSAGARVRDVEVRPVYGPAWKSGIRPSTVIYPVSFVLLKSWINRTTTRARRRLSA